MKILITGGAGYLGTVLARRLLARQHRVRILDNLLHGGSSLRSFAGQWGYEFVCGDIRDPHVVDIALEGVDAVVHLAAIVGDPACARNEEEARAVNHAASITLLDAVETHGIPRFIFASTCSNYGRMDDPMMHLDEDSPLRPISVYAETKVAVEREIADRSLEATQTCSFTSLRFATLFGLSPRMRYDLTVNEFTRDLFRDRRLILYGEQFWRPYVHVEDAARAIGVVLEERPHRLTGRVLNVGDTRENYRKGEIVALIAEELGGEVEIERVKKDEDPRDYRVSFGRIRRELGFGATRTVRDGIREVLAANRAELRPLPVGAGV